MSTSIQYVVPIVALVSVLGCLLIVAIYLRYPSYRNNFYRKLVFVLSIYDILYSITLFWAHGSNKQLCVFQSVSITFTGLLQPNFSAIISLLIWYNSLASKTEKKLKLYYKVLHLICIVVAVIFTVLVFCFDKMTESPNTNWCFLSKGGWLETYYIILWIDVVISIAFYIKFAINVSQIQKRTKENNGELWGSHSGGIYYQEMKMQLRMVVIPLSLLLSNIFASIKRTREFATDNPKPIFWLDLMQAITNPSQGLFDCIVFIFFDKYSRNKLKGLFKCKGDSELDIITLNEHKSNRIGLLDHSEDYD
ncbi:g protein-coupled receptor [Anaeramoeba flamelloides]|uniref:G protein-coupled receptor n=1 Tax=Anaeramoeba flamelloides TaxID=1746091 RepID=A0ABQ8ZDB9_9EUKA|nr:g protein-coupled receptor [Anaeramoeba flamelloides]